ncbi:hypothetical protein CICLE_v10033319mg [Citrus x clementina]|uniref:Retrotransposon Copia-like N-terminal domain-containing protein n=1 Tax=Citrus clementina TaxID=85681 RepID=V4TIP4_CITCL|nr:hypothetical protein CICLE_v10033319mg [Citrus x clementina]
MAEALSKAQAPTVTSEPTALPIGIKLDGSNYGLWSQVVEMYISGKDKLGYINGELTPPSPTDSMAYQLHGSDVNWKLYSVSHNQTGGSLEKYYTDLQGLWREIDFQRPNPMEFPADIQRYNNLLQEDRVYVFLDGLDDKLDNNQKQAYAHVRREALRQVVMNAGDHEPPPGAVLASRGLKLGIHGSNPQHAGKSGSKGRSSSDRLKCTHCGNMKHT